MTTIKSAQWTNMTYIGYIYKVRDSCWRDPLPRMNPSVYPDDRSGSTLPFVADLGEEERPSVVGPAYLLHLKDHSRHLSSYYSNPRLYNIWTVFLLKRIHKLLMIF